LEGHGYAIKANVKNSVVEYSYAHDVKAAAVFISGPESGNGTGPTGLTVRFNILQSTADDGVIRLYKGGDKSVDVYGNVVLENEATGGLSFSGNSGTIAARIYNNTFFDSFVDIGDPTSTGTIEFRNNLIYELDDIALTDAGSDITAHSNNIFCRTNGGTRVRIGGVNYSASNIGTWEPTAKTANPLFKNTANLPNGFMFTGGSSRAPNKDGLSARDGSPALDSGADLGGAFNGSINSVVRPVGAAWDIGAYESVGVAPAPPQDLRVVEP
jgi:hypothetical protein